MKRGQGGRNRNQWPVCGWEEACRTRDSEGISLADYFCMTWAKMERTQGRHDSQEN